MSGTILSEKFAGNFVEGTMDQHKKAFVLVDHVPLLCIRIVFPQDDDIYQQDKNARCHTARSVRVWLEDQQDEFPELPRPASSLDLNLI